MYMTGLDRICRNAGVSFSEEPGWKRRTWSRGSLRAMRAIMMHDTQSSNAAFAAGANMPTLNYVRDGLGYPLYNILIGRNGHARIVAAGACVHAGSGSGFGMTANGANFESLAISFDANEMGYPVTAAQLETGARIAKAFNDDFGGKLRVLMHGEWNTRERRDPTRVPGGWAALRQAALRGWWTKKTNPKPAPKPSPKPDSKPTNKVQWAKVKKHAGKRADAIFRTGPGTKHRQIREMFAGERVLLGKRRSGNWIEVGDGGNYVHKDNLVNVSIGPVLARGLNHGQFPDRNMPVNATRTQEFTHACNDFGQRHGVSRGNPIVRVAKSLEQHHAYLKKVSGNARKIKTHLKPGGFYQGNIDNKINANLIIGVKNFLNAQRNHYTPNPPTATSWVRNFKG